MDIQKRLEALERWKTFLTEAEAEEQAEEEGYDQDCEDEQIIPRHQRDEDGPTQFIDMSRYFWK